MATLLNRGVHPIDPGSLQDSEVKRKILKGELDLHKINCSIQARSLMNSLLKVYPNERFTSVQALSHPWLKVAGGLTDNKTKELVEITANENKLARVFKGLALLAYIRNKTKYLPPASLPEINPQAVETKSDRKILLVVPLNLRDSPKLLSSKKNIFSIGEKHSTATDDSTKGSHNSTMRRQNITKKFFSPKKKPEMFASLFESGRNTVAGAFNLKKKPPARLALSKLPHEPRNRPKPGLKLKPRDFSIQ